MGLFELHGLTVHCVLFVCKEEIRELSVSLCKSGGGICSRDSADIFGIMCPKAPEKRPIQSYSSLECRI